MYLRVPDGCVLPHLLTPVTGKISIKLISLLLSKLSSNQSVQVLPTWNQIIVKEAWKFFFDLVQMSALVQKSHLLFIVALVCKSIFFWLVENTNISWPQWLFQPQQGAALLLPVLSSSEHMNCRFKEGHVTRHTRDHMLSHRSEHFFILMELGEVSFPPYLFSF